MSQSVPLSTAYQHPGFTPELRARVEDDCPDTFILPLRRRQKKTSAESAATRAAHTITHVAKAETSTAPAGWSSWSSSSGGSTAPGAA
jgi:hypothetical protein